MKDEPVEFTQTYNFYTKGEYSKAYSLITAVCDNYPAWQGHAYEIRMDLAAVMGNLELAEEILEHALDLGFFYNEFALRLDEDLKSLQGRPRFEYLVARSLYILDEEQRKTQPELKIIEPDNLPEGKKPLLIGLHGNNSNAQGFSEYWSYLTDKGWLVALPQSAEIAAKGLYVWNNIERVDKDIPDHYETLKEQYTTDEKKTIIAGFSKGGHAAIHIALKGFFPVSGFLALAPFVGDISPWLPLINSCINKNMRGYFVLGGKDQHCTPGVLLLKDKLIESGIKCEVEIFPEMAHDIPVNFDKVLQRAIQFIFNE